MEIENFVPYELYLKLKEKGLDTDKFSTHETFGYYLELRSNKRVLPVSIATCEYNQNIQQYNDLPDRETAPLYDQIQDWFEENHGLLITKTVIGNADNRKLFYTIQSSGERTYFPKVYHFNTKDEAIAEAINLI